MKVVTHHVPAPPPSYDLLGLTREELVHIRDLLGHAPARTPNVELYDALDKVLKEKS